MAKKATKTGATTENTIPTETKAKKPRAASKAKPKTAKAAPAEPLILPADSTAPEFERAEASPSKLEQIAEPTVEPQDIPAHGAPKDSGKEEINEDVPVKPVHVVLRQDAQSMRGRNDRHGDGRSDNNRRDNRHEQRGNQRNHHGGKHNDDACHCYESPYPKGKLPPPPVLAPRELEDAEKPKPKAGKDGFDRAMEMLDEYYKGTPQRNPNVDHGGED